MNTLTSMIGAQHASIIIPIIVLTSFIVYGPTRFVQERQIKVYSYFEKGCRKNLHATIPKDNMGYDQYTPFLTLQLSNLLFLLSFSTRRHMSTVSPTILSNFFEIGIVACTFSNNLSQKSCKLNKNYHSSV